MWSTISGQMSPALCRATLVSFFIELLMLTEPLICQHTCLWNCCLIRLIRYDLSSFKQLKVDLL